MATSHPSDLLQVLSKTEDLKKEIYAIHSAIEKSLSFEDLSVCNKFYALSNPRNCILENSFGIDSIYHQVRVISINSILFSMKILLGNSNFKISLLQYSGFHEVLNHSVLSNYIIESLIIGNL
ncbi:MAG: hypothetical protein MHPSP_002467, partial [Paramarteilia canceri]